MKIFRNNLKTSTIALVLLLTIGFTLVTLQTPIAKAEWPTYYVPTWVYISVSPPERLGVGQYAFIIMFHDRVPPLPNRWTFYVNVTTPSGITETLGPFQSDMAGTQYTRYQVNETGVYKFQSIFPGYTHNKTTPPSPPFDMNPAGLYIYEPSVSEPVYLTVQEEAISEYLETPLPESYWIRPISNINRFWYQVASNWLGDFAQVNGSTTNFAWGPGPESAHIMWTKPYWEGGIMDTRFGTQAYYGGLVYETYGLYPPVILNGRLYYNDYTPPRMGWYCVDLRTGETLFFHNGTGKFNEMGFLGTYPPMLSGEVLHWGQILLYDNPNQHGGLSYLWSNGGTSGMHGGIPPDTDTWTMFDSFTGQYICKISNAPTQGTKVYGKDGSILKYIVDTVNHRLLIWNTTATIERGGPAVGFWRPYNTTFDGKLGYTLNVSIPEEVTGSVLAIRQVKFIIIGNAGSNNEQGVVNGHLWALSLERGKEGTILWHTTFTPPSSAGGLRVSMTGVYPEYDVFLFEEANNRQRWGYSLKTGDQLWGPTPSEPQWNYYGMSENVYEGMLLSYGYGGVLIAYNITTGEIIWKYYAQTVGFESWYGYTPISGMTIADGKIYIFSTEHSPSMPYRRDAMIRCIDAKTGKQLWNITHWAINLAIADGYLVSLNYYDNQIYCYGKGPTATTVSIQDKVVAKGEEVLVEGRVIDISPGTKQHGQAMRFPDGVPAVADECMTEWMEYVYMQRPRPDNVKGVWVSFDAIAPNGTWIHIGGTHTDSYGMYSIPWTPPKEGLWTIVITFPGSNSYWPSYAQTTLAVTAAPPSSATAEQAESLQSTTESLSSRIDAMQTVQIILIVIVAIVICLVAYDIYINRKMLRQAAK